MPEEIGAIFGVKENAMRNIDQSFIQEMPTLIASMPYSAENKAVYDVAWAAASSGSKFTHDGKDWFVTRLDFDAANDTCQIYAVPFMPEIFEFGEIYPACEPDFDIRFNVFNVDDGPMSISHWGMIDLGRFGVFYMPDGAHWQEDGKTFAVVS